MILCDSLPDTLATITIKFANEINFLQWCKEWNCSVDKIYQQFEYEKEEASNFEANVEKDDVKRTTVDLDDDEEVPKLKKKKVPMYREWNVSDVSKWLKRINSEWERCGYDKLFESTGIDGRCLEGMTNDFLKEIGVSLVRDRIKILLSIGEIGQ